MKKSATSDSGKSSNEAEFANSASRKFFRIDETLLSCRFLSCQLEVSREASGCLRGWITTHKTREVELKGLPAYLTHQRAIQLLRQSYLKFQKEAIEVFPKGLGGMKPVETGSLPASKKMKLCDEEVLQDSMPSTNDIYSLAEAISNEKEKSIVRQMIERLLTNNPEAQDCDLHPISSAGAQALGAALQVNHTLQSLNLYSNFIGDAGAQALGVALQVNHTLQSLNLENNNIGDAGAKALGTALQVNHTLQSLDLSRNQIGDAGIQALAAALKVNQSIQWLNLKWIQIGTVGAWDLGAALQVNQSLQSLFLGHNRIGKAVAQA